MPQPMNERVDTLLEDIDTLCGLVDSRGEVGELELEGEGLIVYRGLTPVLLQEAGVLRVRPGADPLLGGSTRLYTRGDRPAVEVQQEISRQWLAWAEVPDSGEPLVRIVHKCHRRLRDL